MSLRAVAATIDRTFVGHAIAWSALSFVALGIVTAIVPNPVFGRQIPPEPFAIWVWLLSAPLMGIVLATYTAPAPTAPAAPLAVVAPDDLARDERRSSTLGSIAGLGAFLAIGCPVCNKVALVLLGWSGAMTIYAPIQPFIGAASLALLAGTVAWRFRSRVRGGACAVPAA
jgi:hypothetical protein